MTHIGTREAARLLGTSRQTINRRAAAGLIPATKLDVGPRGAYVFDRDDIDAYREAHQCWLIERADRRAAMRRRAAERSRR